MPVIFISESPRTQSFEYPFWNFAASPQAQHPVPLWLEDFLQLESWRSECRGDSFDVAESERTIRSLLHSAEILAGTMKNPTPRQIFRRLLRMPVVRMLWRSHPSISRGVRNAVRNRWGKLPWRN